MMPEQTGAGNVTQLLDQLSQGRPQAFEALLPVVYGELRRQAARYLRRERGNHTLQPTALVNEAYLRLVDQRHVRWQNRAHFFGIAAQAMRRVLVDHARGRVRLKRGGPAAQVTLDEGMLVAAERSIDLLALDKALQRLTTLDARQGQIVELRFFGGLSVEEAAEVIGISPATVKREWSMAKAWLYTELKPLPGAL
jgi:RNA polymerase sigma-70 factor (ECF subfamily)